MPVDKEKKKAYKKAYYEANKEKIKEKAKAYREANKEKIKERIIEKKFKEKGYTNEEIQQIKNSIKIFEELKKQAKAIGKFICFPCQEHIVDNKFLNCSFCENEFGNKIENDLEINDELI